MTKLRVLDLFSGIGGFSLGLERAGMETVAFCETDPFCRRVLAKHWPEVPIYEDVCTLTVERLAADGISVDVICGGFPCQDISLAGRGAGLSGARSGLWFQMHRVITEVSPAWVVIENVSALRSRGLDQVLGSLAEIGFDAEWHCIPASAVGAPHRRDRVWIVAYPARIQPGREVERSIGERTWTCGESVIMADAHGIGAHGAGPQGAGRDEPPHFGGDVADTNGQSPRWLTIPRNKHRQWEFEPDVGRVAHGISGRVDRLKGLGNSVVPQIPEIIGCAIVAEMEAA